MELEDLGKKVVEAIKKAFEGDVTDEKTRKVYGELIQSGLTRECIMERLRKSPGIISVKYENGTFLIETVSGMLKFTP